jgi:F-type H+-transporting ATPase subunit b
MQNLSVISANIWDILISLVNLLLLTLIVKKFLFKPVMKMIGQRRAAIDADYEQAKAAREEAEESRRNYAEAMAAVKETGDQIIADATRAAENRSSAIVAEAREKAADLRRQAEADVVLTRKKAEEDMKREIADVSTQLTGMLLKREINEEDHRNLIDSFLQEIGTDDDDNNK